MARTAELQARAAVADQHRPRPSRVWLMAREATNLGLNFGLVHGVANVLHRMSDGRMAQAVLDLKPGDVIFRKIVLRQPDLAVKDRDQVRGIELGWLNGSAVALQTKGVALRAQQLGFVAAVRLMAGCTSLHECRLVQYLFIV